MFFKGFTLVRKTYSVALVTLTAVSLQLLVPSTALAQNTSSPEATQSKEKDQEEDLKEVSVYMIERIKSMTEENEKDIKDNKIESLEVRFNPRAQLKKHQYEPFFSVIRHIPAKNGKQAEHKLVGWLNYHDYVYSVGILRMDFNQMWKGFIWKRTGFSYGTATLSLFASYAVCTKVLPLFKGAFKDFGEKIAEVVWKGSLFERFILMGAGTWQFTKVESFMTDVANNFMFGDREKETDFTYRVIAASYDQAIFKKPINTKAFDWEAAVDQATAAIEAAKKGTDSAKPLIEPEKVEKKIDDGHIAFVPVTNHMGFAVKSFENFFYHYSEANAVDKEFK